MRKQNNNDVMGAGLVILIVLLMYGFLGLNTAKMGQEAENILRHNSKTLEDLLNGNY